MAKIVLSSTLINEAKNAVLNLQSEVFGSILKNAINQIGHDNVEDVDTLVRNKLKGI